MAITKLHFLLQRIDHRPTLEKIMSLPCGTALRKHHDPVMIYVNA